MVNGCEAVAAEAAGKLVDRLISWPVGKGDKLEARRLRGSVDQRATHRAKVQLRRRRVQKCKGERQRSRGDRKPDD